MATVEGCDPAGVFQVRVEQVIPAAASHPILIERERITAEQAFNVLRRASQHLNIKIREVASTLVETGETPSSGPRGDTPWHHEAHRRDQTDRTPSWPGRTSDAPNAPMVTRHSLGGLDETPR